MKIANTTLHKEACFLDATEEINVLKDRNSVDLFDQNGYHLTKAEQAFLVRNGYEPVERRHEDCMRYDWILWDKKDKAHINHSDIFERKGFSDQALDQLHAVAESSNPMLYKLIKMKPKWGIDISIDYVSPDAVFEVFHYEWDAFEYDAVMEKKEEIEQFVIHKDWDDIAQVLWNRRNEWYYLDFFEQTQWRTDFFGLSPEKFKNVIWKD
jgi:hypothetical protein|tara:strand:+ start:830 stop:1459 length:630 start_codon:yes stop_codon:yes gene_type:complete